MHVLVTRYNDTCDDVSGDSGYEYGGVSDGDGDDHVEGVTYGRQGVWVFSQRFVKSVVLLHYIVFCKNKNKFQ